MMRIYIIKKDLPGLFFYVEVKIIIIKTVTRKKKQIYFLQSVASINHYL